MYKPTVNAGSGMAGDHGPTSSQKPVKNIESSGATGYEILFRKKSNKKHKTWEGDAIAVPKNQVYLIKADSKTIATVPAEKITAGAEFSHGQYEFEVGSKTSIGPKPPAKSPKSTANSKNVSHGVGTISSSPTPSSSLGDRSLASLLGSSIKPTLGLRPLDANSSTLIQGNNLLKAQIIPKRSVESAQTEQHPPTSKVSTSAGLLDLGSVYGLPSTEETFLGCTGGPSPKSLQPSRPKKSNPEAVLAPKAKKPKLRSQAPAVPSVSSDVKEWSIPPLIADKLRPHQIEAVNFLYQCVSGKKHCYGRGAMLADDMGLGKTLTSIALIYSLLNAGLAKTVLVVCPATLIKNWKNEFRKWLPPNVINVFSLIPGEDVKTFTKSGLRRTYPVMIAGYERIRSITGEVMDDMGEFDLVICDEGHRLKSSDSKTLSSLEEIAGEKRVILSGTPIQNNLEEFWTMAQFLNPGVFGSKKSQFTRKFSDPIKASRDISASEDTKELGQEKMRELIETTNEFVLRREQSVLTGHITVPKTEYVVFCKPLQEQVISYKTELADTHFWDSDSGGGAQVLQLITKLRKISTSLKLLKPMPVTGGSFAKQLTSMDPLLGSNKMVVLKAMLQYIHQNTNEKVVIVSGYTETLDLVQQVCGKYNMSWVRLDGATPQNRRQPMVDMFNKSDQERVFAFILSAKSGGVGLNLIGGSRLIMLDCDWNPSIDLQAMARIHRDGQKRPTFIYRLLSAGMIDEKILQRQLTKQGVSDSLFELEDAKKMGDRFSREQLREIFAYRDCKSDTLEQGIALEYLEEEVDTEPVLEATAKETGMLTCILSKTSSNKENTELP